MTRTPFVLLAAALVVGCTTPQAKNAEASPAGTPPKASDHAAAIAWRAFDPATVAAASSQRRIIILSLGTTWCHWCHVMDEKTWADPAVAALVGQRFLPIRADADASPDLKARYAPWGWPATILLTPDAEPLGELKGYVAKEKLLPYLEGLVRDLDAGTLRRKKPPAKDAPPLGLTAAMTSAEAQLDKLYDDERDGWGGPKKYPLLAPMLVSLYRAERFLDDRARKQLLGTAEKLLLLCDPLWGGMYQYSTYNRWDHPHTEKLAEIQGNALVVFADAWRLTGDARYRTAGDGIVHYLDTFMSDAGGGFYANQDADGGHGHGDAAVPGREYYALDDAARRAAGVPFIDKSVFAAHNATVLRGLARWAAVTGDPAHHARLTKGEAALAQLWTDAGFVHAAGTDGIFLEDQVAAAEAYEAMYAATLDPAHRRRWLALVPVLDALIDEQRGGFRNVAERDGAVGVFAQSHLPLGLSARAARVMLRAAELMPEPEGDRVRDRARMVVERLSTKRRLARQGRGVGDALLAIYDAAYAPVHVSFAGPLGPAAQGLLQAAHRTRVPSAVFEHVGPEGRFGKWEEPVVFVCGKAFCSRPVQSEDGVGRTQAEFIRVERSAEAEPTPTPAPRPAPGPPDVDQDVAGAG